MNMMGFIQRTNLIKVPQKYCSIQFEKNKSLHPYFCSFKDHKNLYSASTTDWHEPAGQGNHSNDLFRLTACSQLLHHVQSSSQLARLCCVASCQAEPVPWDCHPWGWGEAGALDTCWRAGSTLETFSPRAGKRVTPEHPSSAI